MQGKDGDSRYSDFRRTASGLTLPFREERGDQTKPVVFVTTRLDTRANVNAADFAPPFHNDYTMPASGQVTVPAEGGALFDLRLNSKGPFRALLDTGGVNGISRGMADRLGLKVEEEPVPFGAIGGSITVHTTRI